VRINPVEILAREHYATLKTLFPEATIRRGIREVFTPGQSLLQYMQALGYEALYRKAVKAEFDISVEVKLDVTTLTNLNLLGDHGLLDVLCVCRTNFGREIFATTLRTPINDRNELSRRLDTLEKTMREALLDAAYRGMPTKLTLHNARHQLRKLELGLTVGTKRANDKFEKMLVDAVEEARKWHNFVHTYGHVAVVGESKFASMPKPEYAVYPTQNESDDAMQNALLRSIVGRLGGVVRFGLPASFKLFLEMDKEHIRLLDRIVHTKVSVTRTVVRFDTPELQRLRLKIEDERAKYELKRNQYIIGAIAKFCTTYNEEVFRQCGAIDVAISTAQFYKTQGERVARPTFGPKTVLKNVFLPKGLTKKEMQGNSYVGGGAIVLHGTNGSGKSTLMRTIATNVLLAHCGLLVFADSAEIKLNDLIGMRFGSNDNFLGQLSSFENEMRHIHQLSEKATADSFICSDELGCSCDAASGAKLLQYYVNKLSGKGVDCVFATHFQDVCLSKETQHQNMEAGFHCVDVAHDHNFGSNVFDIAKACGMPDRVCLAAQASLCENACSKSAKL